MFVPFLLVFFWWFLCDWMTKAIDTCITEKRREFSLFCSCEDSVLLSKKLIRDHREDLFEKGLIFFPIYTSYAGNLTSFFCLPFMFWLLLLWFADLWVVPSEARWHESSLILLFSWWTTLKCSGLHRGKHNWFTGLWHLTLLFNNLLECLNMVTSLASLLLPR